VGDRGETICRRVLWGTRLVHQRHATAMSVKGWEWAFQPLAIDSFVNEECGFFFVRECVLEPYALTQLRFHGGVVVCKYWFRGSHLSNCI
jgi:hypothetical protein